MQRVGQRNVRTAAALRHVGFVGASAGDAVSVNIICVPEVKMPRAVSQSPCDTVGSALMGAPRRVRLLNFEYCYDGTTSIWQDLIHRGDELLDILSRADQMLLRPTIFVCHGLGGLVVKRFFNCLNQHYYNPRYKQLLNLQARIIFLGVPHPTHAYKDRWGRLIYILRSRLNVSRSVLAEAEVEASVAAMVSTLFLEAGNTIEARVVSAFETRPMKIGSRALLSSQKECFVDRQFAETAILNEVLIDSGGDHDDIVQMRPGSEISSHLVSLVASTPLQAEEPVEPRPRLETPRSTAPDDLTWASTLSQEDAHDDERRISTSTPMGATHDSGSSTQDIDPAESRRPDPKLPCHLLRPFFPDPGFHGRGHVLKTIDTALLSTGDPSTRSQSMLRSFALTGMGGVGKTQVALRFAHTRAPQFDAVFFVQADESIKIAEAYSRIAVELNLITSEEAADRVVAQNVVMQWLAEPKRRFSNDPDTPSTADDYATWLLVLDNVENPDVLRDYVPMDGKGAVLFTSRDPIARTFLPPKAGAELEPFSNEEAARFLENLTYEPSSRDDSASLEALTKRLGSLPLAITQIAAVINRRDLTFSECLEQYEKESLATELEQISLASQSATHTYRHSLATVWSLETLEPPALALLGLVSILDPDGISEFVLSPLASEFATADYPSTTSGYESARTTLTKASLVKRRREDKSIGIHRVVQDITRLRMTERDLLENFTLAVLQLQQAWSENTDLKFMLNRSQWGQAEAVVPHIVKLCDLYSRRSILLDAETSANYATLLSRGGWYLQERHNYAAAWPLLQQALSICEKHADTMPRGHVIYADVLIGFSSGYAGLNEPSKTLMYANRHKERRLIAEKPNYPNNLYGMAYTEYALALLLNERYEEAIQESESAYSVQVKFSKYLTGDYWPHFVYFHKAWSLIGLGKASEAYEGMMETLAWREAKFGIDDATSTHTAYNLQVLGRLCEEMAKSTDDINRKEELKEESFSYHQRSLRLWLETSGTGYYRTNNIRIKLAERHAELGHVEAARQMGSLHFDTAIKYFQLRTYYYPEAAQALYKRSVFLGKIGNEEGAKKDFEQAWNLYAKLKDQPVNPRNVPTGGDFAKLCRIWSR